MSVIFNSRSFHIFRVIVGGRSEFGESDRRQYCIMVRVNKGAGLATQHLGQKLRGIVGKAISGLTWGEEDIYRGVRKPIIYKMVICLVVDWSILKIILRAKVLEKIITLVPWSWRDGGVCITTDIYQSIRIPFTKFINGGFKQRKVLDKLRISARRGKVNRNMYTDLIPRHVKDKDKETAGDWFKDGNKRIQRLLPESHGTSMSSIL